MVHDGLFSRVALHENNYKNTPAHGEFTKRKATHWIACQIYNNLLIRG